MRNAFEAWAQRDGHIVRRREDKPEEYLVYETQRRWVIWQAALAHGQQASDAARAPAVAAATAAAPKPAVRPPEPVRTSVRPDPAVSDEAAVRNSVLNEVLDAFSELDENAGMEGLLKVIQSLKKKQKAMAVAASEG